MSMCCSQARAVALPIPLLGYPDQMQGCAPAATPAANLCSSSLSILKGNVELERRLPLMHRRAPASHSSSMHIEAHCSNFSSKTPAPVWYWILRVHVGLKKRLQHLQPPHHSLTFHAADRTSPMACHLGAIMSGHMAGRLAEVGFLVSVLIPLSNSMLKSNTSNSLPSCCHHVMACARSVPSG
eukprot:799566-Pelagomonas_calceolata.AAC.1